jgi:anti-sigma B factor antagonist
VDLRGLTFMDSTGITLLTRWNNFANQDGFDLALVQGEDRIARLFALTGLREYFTFVAG